MALIWVPLSGSFEDYEERVKNLGDLFTFCISFKSDGNHSYHHSHGDDVFSPQKTEWMAVLVIKRKKKDQILEKSVVLHKERVSGEQAEKWLWKYKHNEVHWDLYIYCIYYLHHSFKIFLLRVFTKCEPKNSKRYLFRGKGDLVFKWSEYRWSLTIFSPHLFLFP